MGNVHIVRARTIDGLTACLAAACAASVGCSSPPAEVDETSVLDPSPDAAEVDAGSPSNGGGGELSSMGGSGASGGPNVGGADGGGASSTSGAGGAGPSAGAGGGAEGPSAGAGGAVTVGEEPTSELCDVPDVACGGFAPGSTGYYVLSDNEYQNTVRELVGNVSFSDDALWAGPSPGVVGRASIATYETLASPAAVEAAAFGAQQADTQLACADDEELRACVERFVADFGARAWRGPLSLDEESALMAAYDDALSSGDEALAFESLLRAIFSSPRFFSVPIFGLRSVPTEDVYNVPDTWLLAPYEMASRLSYWLWESPPDDELIESARDGGLIKVADIQAHVLRMMGDVRFSRTLDVVNDRWLRLLGGVELGKDSDVFPEHTEEVAQAMIEQALAFARSHVLQEPAAGSSQWAGLFLDAHRDDEVLASWYEGSPERRGVLTLPRVLAANSGPILTSPAARGVFVRSLLCQDIPPPPPILPIDDPRVTDPTLSARERYAGSEEGDCVACHWWVNPVGFAFEQYDAVGKYRTSELGNAIDVSGELARFGTGASSAVIEFDGVDDLSRHLATSGEAFACLGNRWLEQARVGDACGARGAALSACRGGDIRELIMKLVASESFRFVSETDRTGLSNADATCAQRGIMDCEALTSIDGVEVSLDTCVQCQGAEPGADSYCDAVFPFAYVAIVRGCCSDEDCEGLAPFCGRFTAPHGVCVLDDAI